ncbi:Protein CBG25809 [Caenorhabditis briggsae]|uniref:Protein CBG25809 n=1 Tax=Caenorhabditis briggsae TaxID=6238 RepID=B6IJV2_CAEBR|nr:Protein CBG25809 [Caenorhabditis briggsae]CAS00182.1 Protein CBG25809 [Caenorhabditis briggsae]
MSEISETSEPRHR